jgi:hypothetical protein
MKNTLMVKTLCFVSNFFGTVLLIYGGISYVALLFMHTNYVQTIGAAILGLPDILLLGVLLLGVTQLLRHVSGQTDSPGWILRKGEFIIYLAIVIRIVQAIWRYSTVGTACFGGSCSLSGVTQKPTLVTIIELAIFFVRILIMFGVAQSLRAMGYSSSRKSVDSN